jgi:hypothetical protein
MSDFHMSERRALHYPLCRAFALVAAATEARPMSMSVRSTDGYIAQEAAARAS